MAKTNLRNFTVQEKLNKMDLDVITVTTESNVDVDASGEIAIKPLEIPNAVAVPGGTALLQTCLVYNPTGNDQPLDIYISDTNQGFTNTNVGGSETIASANLDARGTTATILNGVQAIFNSGTGNAVGTGDTISFVSSIGAPVKAAAGSTSLFLWAVASTTATSPGSVNFTIKLGLVKD